MLKSVRMTDSIKEANFIIGKLTDNVVDCNRNCLNLYNHFYNYHTSYILVRCGLTKFSMKFL